MNLKHFPASAPSAYEIFALHPDKSLRSLLEADPTAVVAGARAHRAELLNPPRTREQYLEALAKQSLPSSVEVLRGYIDEI